jgi:hypothetical protein
MNDENVYSWPVIVLFMPFIVICIVLVWLDTRTHGIAHNEIWDILP